jgi:ATP-dependent Clp protease ATP-binding subunit ClpX
MKNRYLKHLHQKNVDPFATIDNDFDENITATPNIYHNTAPLPNPREIKQQLDKYIIGQDEAKKTLALTVYNHYTAARYNEEHKNDIDFEPIGKNNVLMYGPTGCGKTELIKQIARILNHPIAIINTGDLTSAGYKGKNVNTILDTLLTKAGGDVKKAATGIIFLDEFDKLSRNANGFGSHNENRPEVMQELLPIIEGGEFECGNKIIKTDNILFICAGAFEGLDKIIQARCQKITAPVPDTTHVIGFKIEEEKTTPPLPKHMETTELPLATTEDFLKFGLIREIMGRLPTICRLNALTEQDIEHILTTGKNSVIKQKQKLIETQGCKLVVEPAAITAIAKHVIAHGTGARGLTAIVEKVLRNTMYNLAGDGRHAQVTITAACVQQGSGPIVTVLQQRPHRCAV